MVAPQMSARSGNSTALSVRQYLQWARGQTIPPFVLEVLLRSGRSFYVKDVFDIHEEEPDVITLRVWDLRALSETDKQRVMLKLNTLKARDSIKSAQELHPNIDEGNLRVRISEIEGLMEWHDRFWPDPLEPERKLQIGFEQAD